MLFITHLPAHYLSSFTALQKGKKEKHLEPDKAMPFFLKSCTYYPISIMNYFILAEQENENENENSTTM